ncbi:MAG: FAD-dependent thymidylate synthase [Coriobacteriia bacterium]|nr:FAD-dependent thymidylate synthase [Coriobacteriia bacterium]
MYNLKTSAKIVMDSLIDGLRVTTFEVSFPRFILPELNTHRVFSRNSASSRARSIKRTFAEVMESPFYPHPFTKNQKGMSGQFVDDELQEEAQQYWLQARDSAVLSALDLLVGQAKRKELIGDKVEDYESVIQAYSMHEDSPSIHKQHLNRLLEPFMYHTAIITASMWDNFFKLRIADDAQPEIHELAILMKEAFDASKPVERDWHLPYMDYDEVSMWDIKRSAASCASVSYKSPSEINDAAVERIFTSMFEEFHMSPFEHQALSPNKLDELLEIMDWKLADKPENLDLHGNLSKGIVQLRKVMEHLEK